MTFGPCARSRPRAGALWNWSPAIDQAIDRFHIPQGIADVSRHCGRVSERPVKPHEFFMDDIQGQRVRVIFDLPWENARQAREPAHGQVLPPGRHRRGLARAVQFTSRATHRLRLVAVGRKRAQIVHELKSGCAGSVVTFAGQDQLAVRMQRRRDPHIASALRGQPWCASRAFPWYGRRRSSTL